MRDIFSGEPVGYYAGIMVQIHQKEIWRRSQDFPDGTVAPPLPKERLSRSKDRNPFLDSLHTAGYTNHNNIEIEIEIRGW